MKQVLIVALLNCFIVLILNKSVHAVTTTIDNFTSPISADPFTIDVTIASASAGTNYLRIDLYKTSTTNYFGDTFNGSTWYNSGDYIQYLPVTIQSGNTWKGQIQGRLGNPTQTQLDGQGPYKMRVRRYTSSGNYNSIEAGNSSVDIVINIPTITTAPTESPTVTATITQTVESISPTPTVTPSPQSYEHIYLSEVMVNPIDGEKEWIEIYNGNDFQVDLNNWFLDDIENEGSPPKIFSLNIDGKKYETFELTSPIFNNSGDSVRLLDYNKNLKDSFEYGQTEQGKTFGRKSFDSDNFCLQEPSKNSINNQCLNPTPLPTLRSEQWSPAPTQNFSQTTLSPTPTEEIENISQLSYALMPTSRPPSSEVLGLSTNASGDNNKLINLFSFLSFSYSLLTIISILFRMRLNYGKDKKFYTPIFHST